MTKKEKMRLAGYSSEEIRELMSATRNQILSAEKCGDLLLAQNLSSDMNVLNEAREMKARGKLRVRQTTKKKADHKNQLDP
ncbi:MAG: hypothetical protein LBD94_03295, partial [Rickettsiales bacterium]|nr:hypothetical protein [Rickettsiales bacterium]